ncbi:hypothetical protein [uncultured Amaricoccus sp.]|uniref:hypothetical protein n=1 Tax=uncultured Amaricoccus sp. TaxID=339341 RepID=UPI00262AE4EB|nr:hypothetical protein [uncultured Amaricoccus sp.]
MGDGRKQHSAGIALVMLGLGLAAPAGAQGLETLGTLPGALLGEETAPAPSDAEKLDTLLSELADPDREDWERVEGEINRIWSRSGSDSMDLLLRRGNEALQAEDYPLAVEHLSALVDHAPDFAEGWNARATGYFLMDEYSLAIADVEHVLALNPRHFGALAGLGFMLDELNQPELALKALTAAQKINPHRPNINESVKRLERATGAAEL